MPLETWQEQLRRGNLDLAILLTVAAGPRYGLAIIQHLDSYWVEDEAPHPRKYYRLTRQGARCLTDMKSNWRAFAGTIERLMDAAASAERNSRDSE